jgi:hypothetical protein
MAFTYLKQRQKPMRLNKNDNALWTASIKKELDAVLIAFKVMNDGNKPAPYGIF